MNRVDVARFEFDFDTTWVAFFADSQLRIYSRYGGRDEHEPESRMSKKSLLQTMHEVLAAHREAKNLNRPAGAVAEPRERHGEATATDSPKSIPIWQPQPKSPLIPTDMPLVRKSHNGCLHCHQVREYSLLQAFHDGRFTREMLFPFPLPENTGLKFHIDHGHRIAEVAAGSSAESAGLRRGDVIRQIAEVPIRSEFDFRWALHRLPESSRSVNLRVQRETGSATESSADGNLVRAPLINIELPLPDNWRAGDIHWRKSSRSLPVDWGFRGAPLTKSQRRELNLPLDAMAIQVFSIKPRGFTAALGLQKGDVVTALADQSADMTIERFRSELLQRYRPGDEVHLTILRDGQAIERTGKLSDWFTDETSVP